MLGAKCWCFRQATRVGVTRRHHRRTLWGLQAEVWSGRLFDVLQYAGREALRVKLNFWQLRVRRDVASQE